MSDEHGVRIAEAQVMLDVVFGVVVALPLIEVPKMVVALVSTPGMAGAASLVLQVGALLFCARNWLETRDFFERQTRFHEAAARFGTPMEARLPLPLMLLVPALAAGILTHASYDAFRAFLVMNAIFWVMDTVGAVWLQRSYGRFGGIVHRVRELDEEAHRWYASFVAGTVYLWWALACLGLFAALLAIDVAAGPSPALRLAMAPLVFLPTLRGRAAAAAVRQGEAAILARTSPAVPG
jgi:hypothetical protein